MKCADPVGPPKVYGGFASLRGSTGSCGSRLLCWSGSLKRGSLFRLSERLENTFVIEAHLCEEIGDLSQSFSVDGDGPVRQ
jgi:hypothetical protein